MLLTLIVVGLVLTLLASLAVIACMFSAHVTSAEEAESRLMHVSPPARRTKAVSPKLTTNA